MVRVSQLPDLATIQNVRDQVGGLNVQCADMYGDVVEEFEVLRADYNKKLRSRHMELWKIYQMDDEELNPDGKVSRSVAQDKARYQSVIDCYDIASKLAKVTALKEQMNGIWRYTMPKLQDSIASRLAIAAKYPDGPPKNTMAISDRYQSDFNKYFGDLSESIDTATENIEDLKSDLVDNSEFLSDDIEDTNNGFFDSNL